jgi:hypothetical protein
MDRAEKEAPVASMHASNTIRHQLCMFSDVDFAHAVVDDICPLGRIL